MRKFFFFVVLISTLSCLNALSDKDFTKKYESQLDFARVTMASKINEQSTTGYIFFEGFDFNGYEAESGGIEPMLAKTLELLKAYYGKNGSVAPNHPFVFVGHSQGGLRALAMSTYLKRKDPELYKQLRGVITLSGIDKGLKLLEGNGSSFRSHLYNDVRILTNGIAGIVKVFDFVPNIPFLDFLQYELIKIGVNEGAWVLARYVLGNWLDISNDFGYPIMHNSDWDGHAQIRDMVPQSQFIKNYVLTEQTRYMNHKSRTTRTLGVQWRKGWLGIRYPVIVWKYRPVVVKTTQSDVKVDRSLPVMFLAGTKSNALSLASADIEEKTRNYIHMGGGVFRTAEFAHYLKCAAGIGLFTGSISASIDCNKAANWCFSFDQQIAELIGEKTHDGLVALSSQHLPEYTLIGTGYDTRIFKDRYFKTYPNYNHATINDGDSDSKNLAEQKLRELLN